MAPEKELRPRRAAERRTHPQYGFNADAEVIEEGSSTRIETRITNISQRGCYVETAQSFPLGTAIEVKITKGGESFVAPGRIVYSSDKGMGLTFGDIEGEQHERLEAWLGPLRELESVGTDR
jgi:PilZ domain